MDTTLIVAVAGGIVVLGGLAWWFFGQGAAGNASPKTKAQIAKILEDQGYRVKEIDFEDGVYEVEAEKNGKEVEIRLDPNGTILGIKDDD